MAVNAKTSRFSSIRLGELLGDTTALFTCQSRLGLWPRSPPITFALRIKRLWPSASDWCLAYLFLSASHKETQITNAVTILHSFCGKGKDQKQRCTTKFLINYLLSEWCRLVYSFRRYNKISVREKAQRKCIFWEMHFKFVSFVRERLKIEEVKLNIFRSFLTMKFLSVSKLVH